MIQNYFKIAWRNIKKHKAFSFINGGGLTLGIASCLLLLLYVSYHLSFDHQFKNLDNIYVVENNQHGDGQIYTFASTPGAAAAAIKAEVPGVVQSVRVDNYGGGSLISYKNNSFKKVGLYADSAFFSMFSYHFIKGNPLTSLTQPNSIVITADFAKTLFGNADPMNKMVTRNNNLPMIVTGVIDNIPANESYQFDFVMPYVQFENDNAWAKGQNWRNNFCQTYVQLKDAGSLNRANSILKSIVARHNTGNTNQFFLFPFSKTHLYQKFENGKSVGGSISQIHLFEALALCILLIACVNFMNLSTARSEERAKEVGIRKAIGSNRASLIWQFITESLILSFVSTIVAVIILVLCLPFFNTLLKIKLSLPIGDWSTWVLILSIALVTGLLSGSYPAFYLSSFQPIKVLKGMFKGGGSALPIRKVLVVVQFAFAVFLITATICVYRQIRFIQGMGNGYDKNNLVEIPIEGELGKKAEVLINELKRDGAITGATGTSQSITENGSNTWGISWPGKDPKQQILVDIFYAGYDFTHTTGVKLLAGREFSPDYPIDTNSKTPTVMLNETAAKIMKLKQPVGSIIKYGDQQVTVVGVYKDFVWGSPYSKIPPMVTFCDGYGGSVLTMRLNQAHSISSNIDQINKSLKAINPAYPSTISFVDSEFELKFENEKVLAMLANLFGGLAIIISCLGLFGLAAYAAEQRTKEIGVRKVLGATVSNLAGLLSKDFLKLVLIAIVFAVPVSIWVLNKWLQNYEFRIDLSWWIMTSASIITIVIAMATVSYQAIKAALANPVKSLRSE
ncbi:ABC transporter permease [Mucilaginibacter sp. L196]|uniref:ABC transporter permease n=1 Tax=Mucilaginibacter sp. L196 TaxID=1641870 RepID=UPI00131E37CF|nr:ABC transporter permease [Mucilaginibacter sp. L196]